MVEMFPALDTSAEMHCHPRVLAHGVFRDEVEALEVVDPNTE
jgi:hypothetical protein